MPPLTEKQNSAPPSPLPSGKPPTPSLIPATDAMDRGFADLRLSTELRTLWPRLQHFCPPLHGKLWFIGGQPGNYKTQLMWNLALDMVSLRQRVLFVSLELTIGEIALQAVARYARIPLRIIAKSQAGGVTLNDAQQHGLAIAAEKLAAGEMFLRLHGAPEHGRDIEDIIRSATRTKFDAIFIDHVGMIGRDNGNELEKLSAAVDRLRKLARGQVVKDYYPFVCATSPLKRDAATGDEEKLPAITDFRGSSRLDYDSDAAIILRKRQRSNADEREDPDMVDGFVLKNRQGPCPMVLQFNAQGSICTVTEHHKFDGPPPSHWSERE